MSWFRYIVFAACCALAACGFEPVYKEGGSATLLDENIYIEVQDGRYRFAFREALQDKIGVAPKDAPYLLRYALQITEDELVLTSAVEITRYNLNGVLTFAVLDRHSQQIVFRETVRSSTAYSATSETFPTQTAERDANLRLVRALADQTATRLAITSDAWIK